MTTKAGTTFAPWLAALHASSARLAATVDALDERELSGPSFAGGWSIAQVLSHLGSAAEISTGLVERGLAGGTEAPSRPEIEPVWARWNALGPVEQRENWRQADARHLRLLDSLDERQTTALRVPYFAGLLDPSAYAGYRLSEQSVHAWDIEVALDAAAVIPAAEAALLWDRLDLVATRFRDGATLSRLAPANITVHRTGEPRPAALLLASELHLYPCEPADPTGELTGDTEALIRLVYGRNRPERDASLTAAGPVTLEDLRTLFPGY
jgi:uncharacterized protein (TIGR03083 family)